MRDYLRRFLIVGIMALCISLLFLGGKHSQAEKLSIQDRTNQWIWPAEGVITDIYGTRGGNHKGIDIAGSLGTAVHAVAAGTVSRSYYSTSYGHVVFIKHDDDSFETVYAHLNKRLVKEGQKVGQGELLGEMGTTGHSSGVHLHFEIHEKEWTYEKNNAIDPAVAFGKIELGEEIDRKEKQVAIEASTNHRPTSLLETKRMELIESGLEYIKENANDRDLIKEINSFEKRAETDYGVKEGDTLWSIAQRYHVSVQSLINHNKLTSDVIYPDQILIIPSLGQTEIAKNDVITKKIKQVMNERRALHMLQQ